VTQYCVNGNRLTLMQPSPDTTPVAPTIQDDGAGYVVFAKQ
jgi:hypothetical protein